jgi:hypothetical protein
VLQVNKVKESRRRKVLCVPIGERFSPQQSAKSSRRTNRRKVLALPVRHQGEEDVSPGQREQVLIWPSCVTDQFATCAISVTKQLIAKNLPKTDV